MQNVSFNKIRHSLHRDVKAARAKFETVISRKYESLQEFSKFCDEHPEALSYLSEDGQRRQLLTRSTSSSSKSYHILLYDPEVLEQFEDHEVFIDGTFDAEPKINGCNQLVTILATKFNTVWMILFLYVSNSAQNSLSP